MQKKIKRILFPITLRESRAIAKASKYSKSRKEIQKLNSKLVLITEGSRGSSKDKRLIFVTV